MFLQAGPFLILALVLLERITHQGIFSPYVDPLIKSTFAYFRAFNQADRVSSGEFTGIRRAGCGPRRCQVEIARRTGFAGVRACRCVAYLPAAVIPQLGLQIKFKERNISLLIWRSIGRMLTLL